MEDGIPGEEQYDGIPMGAGILELEPQKAKTDAVWAQSKADNAAKNCIFTQYEFLNLNISICKIYHDTCSLAEVWGVEILMLKIALKDFHFLFLLLDLACTIRQIPK